MFLFSLENNFIALVCEISCLINCEFDNKLCARASIRDQRITICRIIVPISAYRTYRNFLVNPIRPSYRVPSSHRVVELMDVFIGCGKVQYVGRPIFIEFRHISAFFLLLTIKIKSCITSHKLTQISYTYMVTMHLISTFDL